jgi:hypothetical protein
VGEAAAEAVFQYPAFDQSLEKLLRVQMKDIGYVYAGDLAEGEAYEGELTSIEDIRDWSVVGLSESRISLILAARVKVRVEVQYEDRDGAFYDREDGRWFGAEIASTKMEDEVDVEVLVEVDRPTGLIREGKVLTSELSIYGPSEYDY